MPFTSYPLLCCPSGLPPPSLRPIIPRLITYQRKRANRRILNEQELIDLLSTYGELEVSQHRGSL